MTKNNIQQNNPEGGGQNAQINTANYLVTESVNTADIDKGKLNSDLSLISDAEDKKKYKADITKGIANPKVKRAVSSLKLSNPFKGF
jgi:hypothetical protein